MKILNLQNDNRKFVKSIDNFHVLEYIQDVSVIVAQLSRQKSKIFIMN